MGRRWPLSTAQAARGAAGLRRLPRGRGAARLAAPDGAAVGAPRGRRHGDTGACGAVTG